MSMEDRPGEDPIEAHATPRAAEWQVVDDSEPDAVDDEASRVEDDGERMSAVRVRQLSAERRGAYRLRSYCMIGAGVSVVLGMQLATWSVSGVREAGFGANPVGYACGAVAAGMAASYLVRRAIELTRELRKPAQEAPAEQPDFSTLSDGSQHWKNLDEMQGKT
jgi:hypothetical protein